MDMEILSHAPDCRCPGCKAFFWELFVARDEREIMEADLKPLPSGPLEPEGK